MKRFRVGLGWTLFAGRELFGWILVGLGVAAIAIAYFQFLSERLIFEASLLIFAGFAVFRGGIHLLKVAIASQICQETLDAEAVKPNPGRSR